MSSLRFLLSISNIRILQIYYHFQSSISDKFTIIYGSMSLSSNVNFAKCITPCPPGLEIWEPIGTLGVIVQSLADDILESLVKAESLGNEVIASG